MLPLIMLCALSNFTFIIIPAIQPTWETNVSVTANTDIITFVHRHSIAYMFCIVSHDVEQFKTFLETSYELVPVAEDQWPPVQFNEYIKLATVVKVEDFMKEDECTKAMINGNLEFIKRTKHAIEMEKVSYYYLYIHNAILIQCPDWQV